MRAWLIMAQRELVVRPRQRWFYLGRMMPLLILVGLASFVLYLTSSWRYSMRLLTPEMLLMVVREGAGMAIWWIMAATAFGPAAMVARDLQAERSGRRLGLLWLTDLQAGGLLGGKLAATVLTSLQGLLALLPLGMVLVSLQVWTLGQWLLMVLILFSTAVLSASLGLLAGLLPRGEQAVGFVTIALVVTVAVAPVAVRVGVHGIGRPELLPEALYLLLSPVAALREVLRAGAGADLRPELLAELLVRDGTLESRMTPLAPSWAWGQPVVTLAAAWLVLRLAAWRLPIVAAEDVLPPWHVRLREWWRRRRSVRASAAVTDDPLYWRGFLRRGGWRRAWLMALGTCLAIGVAIIGPVLLADADSRTLAGALSRSLRSSEFWWGASVGMVFVGTVVGTLVVLFELGNAFKAEVRERTLEPLLTTPLTSRDLVLGHARSAFSHGIPWLILAAISAVGSLAMNDWVREPNREWVVLVFAAAFLLHLPTLGLLALVSGARWPRHGGLGTTGIVFIGILLTCGLLATWSGSGIVFLAAYLMAYGVLTLWLWRFPAALREILLAQSAGAPKG